MQAFVISCRSVFIRAEKQCKERFEPHVQRAFVHAEGRTVQRLCNALFGVSAAEELFLSRQTLSADMTRLENELGAKLFIRTNDGVILTEDGQYFYGKVLELLRIWDETASHFSSENTRTPVSVAVNSFILWGCSDLFSAFEELHPGVPLTIHSLDMQECYSQLVNGTVDFAIEPFAEQSPSVSSTLIGRLPRVVYVHKDNPLAKKGAVSREDLPGQVMLSQSNIDTILRVLGIPALPNGTAVRHIPNDQPYLNRLLSKNAGIFTACGEIDALKYNRDLVLLPCTGALSEVSVYLLERKNRPDSAAAALVRKHIVNTPLNGKE